MKRAIERDVDSEMAMELQEDQQLFEVPLARELFTAESWAKKFYKGSEVEPEDKEQPVNPFGNISAQPASEVKKKESKCLTDWISENPGTALIAVLLIGGGAYLIGSYLKNKYFDDNRKPLSRRRKKMTVKEEDTEPARDISITKEEVLIGAAAATGGAVLGAVLKDTSLAAAIPVGAIGVVTGKIPLIAVALGLALGGQLRKMFQGFFGNDEVEMKTERGSDLRGKGYIKSMLGTFRL